MEVHTPVMDHPKKRRRRRRIDRPPLTATLVLDPDLGGDQGLLSTDLYEQLFPWSLQDRHQLSEPKTQYIAVSPWAPQRSEACQDLAWTILPVNYSQPEDEHNEAVPDYIVRYPASSSVAQSTLGIASSTEHNKGSGKRIGGLRILVLDIKPSNLSSIYVNVDGTALERHEQIQKEFGGGFGAFKTNSRSNKGKGKAKETLDDGPDGVQGNDTTQQRQKELTAAVRSVMGSTLVARQGDFLSLPLPVHPITHVPLPPAKIILCEPVNQGLLSADTRIIVNRYFDSRKFRSGVTNRHAWSHSPQAAIENGEETSTQRIFSATEDVVDGHDTEDESEEQISESSSPEGQSSSDSDGATGNIISLSTLGISNQLNGIPSSITATPKDCPVMSGTSTPGSVFSSFTTTTARQSSDTGKIFRVYSLVAAIPNELLHPKPRDDEDDESRVYVDIKDLLKLRCFSGDWVKIGAVSSTHDQQADSWDPNVFDLASGDEEGASRIVKVYGLPNASPHSPTRYLGKGSSFSHRQSTLATSSKMKRLATQAWLSPLLLANLDSPTEVWLAPLISSGSANCPFSPKNGPANAGRPGYPPVAAEVSLAKISTPISQEAAMQEILFLRLKQYFESKRRIVNAGDLIAVTVDADVGRALGRSSVTNENGQETEEMLSFIGQSNRSTASTLDVIWFRVGQIGRSVTGKQGGDHGDDIWGEATCIDPTSTRMTMGTSHQCRLPSSSRSTWRSYLGLIPKGLEEMPTNSLSTYMSTSPLFYVSALQRRLRELIAAAASPRAAHLGIEPTLILLHSNQRNIGKYRTAEQAASDLGLHTFSIDAYDIISEGNAGDVQESGINTRIARGLSCGAQHTLFVIRHLEALTSNRMIAALRKATSSARMLIATTTQLDRLPENLRSLFTHEIEISAPDEGEREGILHTIVQEQGIRIAKDVDLGAVAVKTAALVAGNLVDIVERAVIARQERLESLIRNVAITGTKAQTTIQDLILSGGEWARCVTKADFDLAVDAARKNFADAIGAPKIPNVSWDDVGGLEHVKDAVMETIQLPLERPELFAKGMKKRSGILFYGPPGTGKTLLAKAIATEFSLNFFSVKGPELLNMYIGESEANVRRVFQRARDARPCVVFFDELDSVAPKRGNQGDSGGVMDRIVSQLLAELDGMSDGEDGGGGGGVFVIGATNRPDLLDQALLRPGRFDKMLYLGISDTHRKQQTILEALTRKFSLDPDMSLARVAESLPFTYTGADLYALCSDAMLKAITRQTSVVDAKIKDLPKGPVTTAYFFDHLATKDDIAVMVTEDDFRAARWELVGSVSAKELEHYQRVRHSFEAPSKQPHSAPIPNAVLPTTSIQQPMPTRPKYKHRTETAIRSSKAPSDPTVKGKGKAAQISQSESDDDDDDDAYVTSNDSPWRSPDRKVKQRATMIPKPIDGFRDPSTDDDADIYS
ncbi:MAG: hypothetical protein Q9166_003616 [cf. Caloplaca sp. 2 TL-2023]